MSAGNQRKKVQLLSFLKNITLRFNILLIGILILNAVVFVWIDFFETKNLVKVFDFIIILMALGLVLFLVFRNDGEIKINKKWPKYVFFAGIIFRLFLTVHGFIDRPEPTSDYRKNEILANQLYFDHDYVEESGDIVFRSFRPPGGPLIIAASYFFFESRHNAHFVYSIMSFLLLYITFLIIAKHRNIFSLLYLGFIALSPSVLLLGTFSSSQLPFFLLFSLIILLLMNYKNSFIQLFLLGILLGCGSLVRLNMILFLPAVFLFIFEVTDFQFVKTIKSFAVILLFWLLAILPWSIRNYMVQDKFVLISTNGGYVMYLANVKDDHTRAGAYDYLPNGISDGYTNELNFTEDLKAKTFDFIKENPGHYLKGFPYKMKRLLGMGYWSVDYFAIHIRYKPPDYVLKLIRKLDYLACWFIYMAGFIFLCKKKKITPLALFLLLGYCIYVTLDLSLFETGQRYHFPYLLFPFLTLVLNGIRKNSNIHEAH